MLLNTYNAEVTMVNDLTRLEDCRRIGKAWKSANPDNPNLTYRCVQVAKNAGPQS
jgi:hypothetical protein